MTRGSHWWTEPPWWAWVVIIVGTVVLAVGMPMAKDRGKVPASVIAEAEAEQAAEEAEVAADRAAQESATAAEEARVDIAALGDSYTGGSNMDSGEGHRWHDLLTEQFPWDVTPYAVGGTGFVSGEDAGTDFAARVPEIVAAQPDVVVVAGGHNDEQYPAGRVDEGVRAVLTELRAGLPGAQIVVVGVLWPGQAPASVFAINDSLRQVASEVGAVFVDALNEGWFDGANQSLIGSDGTHPTDEGHAALAQRIAGALAAAGVPTTV